MKAPHLCLALLTLLPACQGKPAEFVGVPFCVVESGKSSPRFAKRYIVMLHHRDGDSMSPLNGRSTGPRELGAIYASKVELLVLACDEADELPTPPNWNEQLADGQVPRLCREQEVVFNGPLELETSPRADVLGYRGWFRFPELELECAEGELSFADRLLFPQILSEFQRAVSVYQREHEALPASLELVYSEMLEPELPPDPWGTALRFTNEGQQITLTSAGPDATFDTEDDISVLEKTANGSSSIMSWPLLDDTGYGSYAALLDRRKVPHSL